ncbi:MAG: UbiH/UbiF family hydroxylase [Xanthobacteraceae bacterium]
MAVGSIRETADVVVVGGGPAGLMAAIALAQASISTILVAKPPIPDNRTSALLAGSVTALEALGVWERCRGDAAPLRVIRLVDDTGRLLRAPEVRFDATEIGLDAFGYNIENRHLMAALEARVGELPTLRRIDGEAARVEPGDHVTAVLKDGTSVSARLAVGADGHSSLCRTAAGIATRGWTYRQTALTFNLRHTTPHDGISTEFHTATGPFTLVPLPGRRSSLVFVLDPAAAERWRVAPEAELAAEIERRSHSILGRVEIANGPGVFTLAVSTARSFAARRIALVGEAAHLIPPIGAQGLNLGLRDAATIAELVVDARRHGADPGGLDLLSRYDRRRRSDVTSRTVAVDLLNRSLLSGFLPIHGARGLGLLLLDRVGPLRRAMMREGVATTAAQPRLMRGEPL